MLTGEGGLGQEERKKKQDKIERRSLKNRRSAPLALHPPSSRNTRRTAPTALGAVSSCTRCAMSCTGIANGDSSLRRPYAISRTEIARGDICLREPYAMPCTGIAYSDICPRKRSALSRTRTAHGAISPRKRYATSYPVIAHGTICLGDVPSRPCLRQGGSAGEEAGGGWRTRRK